MRRRKLGHLAAVSFLTLTAFLLRAASLDAQSLWRDEVDALRFATAPWSEMLGNFTRPGWNGPLYYLLLRGWIVLTGTSEYALRYFSLAFGVLCVPLLYTLGRRLFDRNVGLIAALLMTLSPYLTWYSQEVKMYTLVPALTILAIYALHRAINGDGWIWWAVQIIATTLAFYSHILAALLIPVQVLICLIRWSHTRQQWLGALTSLALLTLPYLPLAVWQAPLVLKARETGFHHYTLRQMVEILLNGWSTGITGWGYTWGALLLSGLATWGSFAGIGQSKSSLEARSRKRLSLLIWLMFPLLAVWLVSLRQPLFTDRYLIWSAPAYYLLAALGLISLRHLGKWGRWAMVLPVGAILILNSVNLWQQATTPIKADFRAAAEYVANYRTTDKPKPHGFSSAEEHPYAVYLPFVAAGPRTPDTLIIFQIPYAKYAFDHYFPPDDYPHAEGLYTNHRAPDGTYLMSEQEAAWRMREMTEDHTIIWLIATEVPMWDERGLVQAWLDEHAQRTDEAHFARIDVYRYTR